MIEGHGDDIHRYEAGMVRMNFSTNIYQQADHSALKAHLAERIDVINNYPEPEPLSLEQMIAERLGISGDERGDGGNILDCAEIAQECVDYPTAYVQRVCRRVQNQQPYRDIREHGRHESVAERQGLLDM